MKAKFVLITLLFTFLSCNKSKIHDDFDSNFDNNRWNASDVRVFEFENTKSEGICDLKLHFGHVIGFQFKEVPLDVEIVSPDGMSEELPIAMKLSDESGKDIGD